MNKVIASTLATAIVIGLSACAGNGAKDDMAMESGGNDSAQYQIQLKAAEAAYAKVDAIGNAWVFTADFIEEAKKAAEENKFDAAIKLLTQAKFQSDMAYKQGEEQKQAGPVLF